MQKILLSILEKRASFFCMLMSASVMTITCSLQKTAVGVTASIIEDGISSLYRIQDLDFAEKAIPGNLLQLDIFLENDPDNKTLLLLAIEGYTGYALGFVEDTNPQNALTHYKHARDYGFRLISQIGGMEQAVSGNTKEFKTALEKTDNNDVPALFWTASAWGNYINLKSDIEALADMGKVEILMSRVLELDESFYFGGAHLFLGVLESEKGFIGNQDAAKNHFERALEISENKFLLTQVLYAKHYARMNFDRELFVDLLQKVLSAPDGILPDYYLFNKIAKKKAALYLEKVDEWFDRN